jgi:hypothetical protein
MTDAAHASVAAYVAGARSFVVGLRPQDAITMPLTEVLDVLRARHGHAVDIALSPEAVDLDAPLAELPAAVRSPVAGRPDSSWLKRTNMVGINLRTVGGLGNVVKYGLTLPAAVDAVQFLPFWEPGVVKSLYGMASWNLDTANRSDELRALAPHLDTIDRQLRAVTNLLHVTGRAVGMDVVPHTDRFAEQALANPALFEWMHIREHRIVDHTAGVLIPVVHAIMTWLNERGPALAGDPLPPDADTLFALDEGVRLRVLFGDPGDLHGRIARRVDLIQYLKWFGLEPIPATMGPPYRDLVIDPDPAKMVIDEYGMQWPDIVVREPQLMSRVFSPMARYRFFEPLDDNRGWQLDFDRPYEPAWRYVCEHYARARHVGNFDFLRGDMAHVQMRPDGVPAAIDDHYDVHRAVKRYIQREHDAPYFASFAEAFLGARDVFHYGEELDHLEAAEADVVLGDLQSTVVGEPEHLRLFRRYLDDLATRRAAPAYTLMTADKDDPRFDAFYRAGNEARLFTALLLPDMPSYVGLGFEIRDVSHEPAPNEHYTKLFVFEERGESNIHPSKARFSDTYVWGTNQALFERLTAIRVYADDLLAELGDAARTRWLLPPDATGLRGLVAWTQAAYSLAPGARPHLCVVNYDLDASSGYTGIPGLPADAVLLPVFSTLGPDALEATPVRHNGYFHRLEDIAAGEGRAYVVDTRS